MLLQVTVKTSKREQRIEKIGDDSFEVQLESRAEKGSANEELIKLFKKEFGYSTVKIVKGLKSKRKVLKVE